MKALYYKFISFSKEKTYMSILYRITYLVNHSENIYIYLEFQDCHLPYYYTITVYKHKVLNSKEFISFIYIVGNYYNTYLENSILDFL